MKLEQQVVSLELAKKLKELGFEQDSLFYWVLDGREWYVNNHFVSAREHYPAYTVAELGEMLPAWFKSLRTNLGGWFCDCDSENVRSHYRNVFVYNLSFLNFSLQSIYLSFAETEADARAKMLIWLKESGYLPKEHQSTKEELK